jgi:hypothetical protein
LTINGHERIIDLYAEKTELQMSAMSNLYTEIQELLEEGLFPTVIASRLEVPLSWVDQVRMDLDPPDMALDSEEQFQDYDSAIAG